MYVIKAKTKTEHKDFKPFTMTQVIRHTLQTAGFLLLPGLFILTLGSFKGLWQAIISGSFTWAAMGAPLLTLLAVIPITALWGRFFCGYLCAFGSMQELMRFVGKQLHLSKVTVSPAADRILRKMKYVVLAGLFLLWTLGVSYDSASPWHAFGQYAAYDGWADLKGWLTAGGLLLALIAIGSLFAERAFCRYFCPLGGIFSLVSRWRLFNVKKNGQCVGCARCDAECPMGIDVSLEADVAGHVSSPECIDCFRCIDQCNVKALYTAPREAVAGSAAAIAVAGLYQVGAIVVKSPISTVTNGQSLSQGQYIDGAYEGSAQGYRGAVTVQVKVSGGMISSITVESYRDDDEFFNRAKNTVINEIISAQSTDVQTVSGATYSSRGIMQAVANALGIITTQQSDDAQQNGQRGGSSPDGTVGEGKKSRPENNGGSQPGGSRKRQSDDSQNTQPDPSQNDNQTIRQNTDLDFSGLTDGTYSGTGQGRNGSIQVTVTVRKGKVTSITIESANEDAEYFNRAKDTVIGEIIDSQSLNVQTVSGATMSSNGIIDAVANALDITYTNPNSRQGTRDAHHSDNSQHQGRGKRH